MIKIVAKMPVKAEEKQKFIELAKELVECSRKDAGCVFYGLNENLADPNCLAFIECWEDQAAIDAHGAAEHFQRIFPQLCALCEGEPAVDNFEELI